MMPALSLYRGVQRRTHDVCAAAALELHNHFFRHIGVQVVHVGGASFSWTTRDNPEPTPVLSDISLTVRRGELVVVVGEVGAGKSSMLQALLGELRTLSGSVSLAAGTTVAYTAQVRGLYGVPSLVQLPHFSCAPASALLLRPLLPLYVGQATYPRRQRVMGDPLRTQDTWIQNTTVRENILMGLPYNEARYQAAVEASALLPDLRVLAAGDETEIGEKGVNLSGGQVRRRSGRRTSIYRGDR